MASSIRSLTVQDAYLFDGGKVVPRVKNCLNLSKYYPKPRMFSFGKIARIDYSLMQRLGISSNDVIEIKGKSRTVVRCLPIYPSDEGKNMIRVDCTTRDNSLVGIGDNVSIRRVKAYSAKKVVMGPMDTFTPVTEYNLKDALVGIPLIKGEEIAVPYFADSLNFLVDYTEPNSVVLVGKNTVIELDYSE